MDLLVIGIGNELRCDDGAGRAVADRIGALGLPGVSMRSVIQLVPELAVDLAGAGRVVFVDADIGVSSLVVRPVEAAVDGRGGSGPSVATTHHVTPGSLVALAGAVGSRVPWPIEQLSIPATRFEFGAPMSAATAAAVEEAVEFIVERAANG